VEWLCTQSASLPLTVDSQTVVDYVEDGLTAHFFTPMLQDLSQRRKLGACHAVSHSVMLALLMDGRTHSCSSASSCVSEWM